MKSTPSVTAALLLLSAVLLGVLVPGGPIETRNFSHISPWILGSFNTFLTSLDLGSFVIAYLVFRKKSWACRAAAFCGIAYFLVYVLDLGKIFPVSPDAMPRALYVIEIIGTLVSVPLTVLALQAHRQLAQITDAAGELAPQVAGSNWQRKLLTAAMLMVGLGVIVFATLSAMGK